MRIRTLAAAVVAAAGLSVTLTGAASAATAEEPPPGDVFVLTCEDGRAVVRPATEEDRERIEEMRSRADVERVEIDGPDGKKVERIKVDGAGGEPVRVIKIVPGHRIDAIPGERGAKVGEKAQAVCAAKAAR
jgi:hypothetical protein